MASLIENQNKGALFLKAYQESQDRTTKKAKDLLEKGANLDNTSCMMLLSVKYLLGSQEYSANRELSDFWNDRMIVIVASEAPSKDLHPLAVEFYSKFKDFSTSAQKANSASERLLFLESRQQFLEKAARYGHPSALSELGMTCLFENKIPESTRWFEEAAIAGDFTSQEAMIEHILNGISVIPEDRKWDRYLAGLGFFFKVLVTLKCKCLSKPECARTAEQYETVNVARSIFADKFALDFGVTKAKAASRKK